MRKIVLVLFFIIVGSACFMAGLYAGLDQKATMQQSFRTALYQAQTDLKSLKLQAQPDQTAALQSMTQRSLGLNLHSMVLLYMSDYEIDPSSFQLAQNLINEVDLFATQQNMPLFTDKKHWRHPETVIYIQSNLKNIAQGQPADKSALDKVH